MGEQKSAPVFQIATIPVGFVWSHPKVLGSSIEEVNGPIAPERMQELTSRAARAADRMMMLAVLNAEGNPIEKPS